MQKQAGINISSQDDKLRKLQEAENSVHLMNINEDPILTGYVRHILKNGENKIGSKVENGFKVSGLGVGDLHAFLQLNQGNVVLRVTGDKNKTVVNGEIVWGEKILKHGDKVLFGNNNLFVLLFPGEDVGN